AKAFETVPAGAPNPPAKTSTASNAVVFSGESIGVVAADLTLGAVLGHVVLPKGAEVLYVMLDATDLDTNGAPTITLSIGDADDDDRLLAASDAGQAGGDPVGPTIAKTGFGHQYEEEALVQVKVKAAPATAAATGTIKYGVAYVSQ